MQIFTTLKGSTQFVGLLVLALIVLFQVLAAILPVAKSVGEFAKDPQSAARTASMQEVRSQLGKLIKQATPKGSKFVIFIDDLDRCQPPRSVDILEAVNQLLDQGGVVTVLMSNMQVVAKCAEIKYRDLAGSEASSKAGQSSARFSSYGWNFLQKIVQLQFDLPVSSATKIRNMVSDLAREVPAEQARGWLDQIGRRAKARSHRAFSRLRASPNWTSRLFALGIITLGISWGFLKFNGTQPPPVALVTTMASALVGAFIAEMFVRILARVRESTRRQRIDAQIKERITAGERDFSQVEAYVRAVNSAWGNDPAAEGLVRERLQRYLEDESELQREAEDEVMRHLEPMPRHAKRLLNRLRLLLFIAHERRMFGGNPELTSRHIGKWAVLGERWPELLQAVSRDPNIMKRLEKSATHEAVVKERAPYYEDNKALRRFCLSRTGVKLWPVVRRILEFAPSTTRRSRRPFAEII